MGELISFHKFLSARLSQFGDATTPEEALDMWRAINPTSKDFDENISAIREALDDMDAGENGVDLKQFDAEFRARHKIA
jgi:hypothetical protein